MLHNMNYVCLTLKNKKMKKKNLRIWTLTILARIIGRNRAISANIQK